LLTSADGDIAGIPHLRNHLFDRAPFPCSLPPEDGAGMPVDISEKDGQVIVRASLPGYCTEEINLQIDNGVLSIRARCGADGAEEGEQFYRRERYRGVVSRRVALPHHVHEEQVEADLSDGVLTVRMPTERHAKAKRIEIRPAVRA
jgi:HSP20 family protein